MGIQKRDTTSTWTFPKADTSRSVHNGQRQMNPYHLKPCSRKRKAHSFKLDTLYIEFHVLQDLSKTEAVAVATMHHLQRGSAFTHK